MGDKLESFVTPSEKEEFMTKLQEVEDWLYEDGEDETKGVYIAKLEELKKVYPIPFCMLVLAFPFPKLKIPKKQNLFMLSRFLGNFVHG